MSQKVLYIIFSLFMLLIACENESTKSPRSSPKTEEVTKTQEKVSFQGHLEELIFLQDNAYEERRIYEFNTHRMEEEPKELGLHKDSVYFYVLFDTKNKERLQVLEEQINIQGGSSVQVKPARSMQKGTSRLKVTVENIKEKSVITLGDLDPITLIRKQPISVELRSKAGKQILHIEKESVHQHYLPQGDDSFRLVFSSPMDTHSSLLFNQGQNYITGSWINDKTYEFTLNQTQQAGDYHIDLTGFLSQDGNYTSETIKLTVGNGGNWYDFSTGEKVGWSEFDEFYNDIVFSPDQKTYIGVIHNERDPNTGRIDYSFLLEKKGEGYQVVVESLPTDVTHQNLPLQWVGNHNILFADHKNVYQLNVKTGEQELIFSKKQHSGDINTFAYDPYQKNYYVNVLHREDGYLNRWVYDTNREKWEIEKKVSGLIKSREDAVKALPIYPTASGVYWSIVEEGEIYTIFQPQGGERQKVRGEIFLRKGSDTFLKTLTNGAFNNIDALYSWNPHKGEYREILDTPDQVLPIGDQLFVSKNDTFLEYLSQNEEWSTVKKNVRFLTDQYGNGRPYVRAEEPFEVEQPFYVGSTSEQLLQNLSQKLSIGMKENAITEQLGEPDQVIEQGEDGQGEDYYTDWYYNFSQEGYERTSGKSPIDQEGLQNGQMKMQLHIVFETQSEKDMDDGALKRMIYYTMYYKVREEVFVHFVMEDRTMNQPIKEILMR